MDDYDPAIDPNDAYEEAKPSYTPPAALPTALPATPVRGQMVQGGKGPDGELSHGQELMAQRRAAQAAKVAQADTSTGAFNPKGETLTAPGPEEKTSALGDFARQVWVSTVDMGQAAIGAASFTARQLGADPDTVLHIEQTKANVADYAAKQASKLSPEAKAAMHASIFGGKDGEGNDVPTPNDVGWAHYAGATLAGLVPQVALAALPGGLVGRVVSAAGFGVLDAGGAYNEFTAAIDKAKPEELMRSPVYKSLVDQGVPDIEARKQLVQAIAPSFMAGHFAVGTAAGAGIGGMLTKGAAGAAGRGVLGRAGIGAAEGAGVMGGQGAGDNALDQGAAVQSGTQATFDPSALAKAFIGGSLGGAVLGAAGGLLHGKVAPETKGVPPAEAAALAEAMPQTPEPLRIAGPKADGSSPIILPDGTPQPEPPPPPPPQVRGQSAQENSQPGTGMGPPADVRPADTASVAPPDAAPAGAREPPLTADEMAQLKAWYEKRQANTASPDAASDAAPGAAREPPLTADERTKLQAWYDARQTDAADKTPLPAAAAPDTLNTGTAGERPLTAGERRLRDAYDAQYPDAAKSDLPPAVADIVSKSGKRGKKAAAPEPVAAPDAELATPVADTSDKNTTTVGDTKGAAPAVAADAIVDKTPLTPQQIVKGKGKGKGKQAVDAPAAEAPTVMPAVAPVAPAAPAAPAVPAAPAPKLTARQIAKGKRAAEVAATADAVAAAKTSKNYSGEDGTESPTNAATPTKPPVSHAEAIDNMQSALKTAGTAIKTIGKGQLDKVLAKASREIEAIIKTKPADEAGVHEAVAEWGKSSTEPLPMSTTRRRPVAEQMLQLLTGKGYDSMSTAEIRESRNEDRAQRGRAENREADVGREESRVDDREATVMEREAVRTKADHEIVKEGDEASAKPEKVGLLDTDLGEEEYQASEGVTNYGDLVEKKRSEASNKTRVGKDLLEKVLNGDLTVHEADAAFGRKVEGSPGRARTLADFGAVLDAAIKRAEDPRTAARLHKLLSQLPNEEMTLGERRSKRAEIDRGLSQAGSEHANTLRKLKSELDDPVGTATTVESNRKLVAGTDQVPTRALLDAMGKRAKYIAELEKEATNLTKENGVFGAAPLQEKIDGLHKLQERDHAVIDQRGKTDYSGANLRDAPPAGLSKEASRYVRMLADPRVNGDLSRALDASERHGVDFNAHDALRTLLNSRLVKIEARPMAALAERFLKLAPDVPVMTSERAAEYGFKRPEDYGMGSRYSGAAMRDAKGTPTHIILQSDMGGGPTQHIETLLHEIAHTISAKHLESEIKQGGGPSVNMLREIGAEIQRQAPTEEAMNRLGIDGRAVADALQNVHELHAMILTNPSLQAAMSRMTVSDQFRANLRDRGYDLSPRSSGGLFRYFTDFMRRTLGLDPARSASEYTLLEHILKPVHDITMASDRYNRGVADPVVRDMGTPMLRSVGATMASGKDAVLSRIDFQGLGDKAKKGLLQFSPTDHIIKWNEKLFAPREKGDTNPLLDFRSAQEAIAHVASDAHDRYAERTNTIAAAMSGPEKPTLAKIMNEATLNNVQLGSGADNSHLKTKEQIAVKADLESRFSQLSAPAKAAYEGARDLYSEWHRIERQARLEGLVKSVLPDASPADQKAVTQALNTKAKTDAFLKDADKTGLAGQFGSAWETSRSLVKAVAKIHSRGFVSGDYFPLKRFGDYVVRYGSGDTLGMEMFERRGDAEARRAELKGQNVDELSQVQSRRESMAKTVMPDSPLVNELYDAMRKRPGMAGQADAVRDVMNGVLMEHASRSEASRTLKRRQGVVGASEDITKVLALDLLGHGSRVGHLLHDSDRNEALRAMDRHAEYLGNQGGPGEQITARSVINELQQRLSTGDNASGSLSAVARKATSFGYVQSLMSFSHMLTSTVEVHMNSTSLLGARHGYGSTAITMARALADVSPRILKQGASMTVRAMGGKLKAADWNMAVMARDQLIERGANKGHMTALFDMLDKAGLIDHSMQREMQRLANPTGLSTTVAGTMWQRFLDLNGAGAHAVDVTNKSAIAKAAFDLEMRKSEGNVDQSAKYAVQMVRDVAPNYNLHNKARITTAAGPLGAFAAPMTQFKQYGLSMYGLMANLTKASLHGATKAERQEAQRAFAGVLATHAAMAGGLTLIADPLRYIGGAYDFINADKPHDYQNNVRGFLADTFGPELGEVMARGLPHYLGFDIHRRVGLANLLEVPELESFDKKGVMKMLATAMTGAAGEDAAVMVQGMNKLVHGDLAAGSVDLVPRVVRDVMKAINLADKGVVDGRGVTILPAAKLSTSDIAYQAIGFQPARISEFREGRQAVNEAKGEATAERSKLSAAWIQASPTDRAAIMSQIREFNQANPGMTLTVDQMLKTQQAQSKNTATVGSFGLRLPAKAQAALAASGRFANVQ